MQRAAAARYLDLLSEHLGLVERRRGGRKLMEPVAPEEAAFVRATALSIGLRATPWLRGTIFHEQLMAMLKEQRALLGESTQDQLYRLDHAVYFKGADIAQQRSRTIEQALLAIRDRRMCRLQYRRLDGSTNEYVVEPWCIAHVDGRLFVIARKVPDGRARTFEASDIRSLELQDARFTLPERDESDPAEILRDTIGTYDSNLGPREEVVLQACGAAATLLTRRQLHTSQHVTQGPDEWTTVRLSVVVCPELVAFVLGLLPNIVVHSPPGLRDRVRAAAQAVNGSLWDRLDPVGIK